MDKFTHISDDSIKLIKRVQCLLDNHQAEEALKALNKCGMNTPVIQNARGVCLLRLKHYDAAMNVFRDLVFPDGAFSIPPEIPTLLRTNYVTSLFCQNNIGVGISLLYEIPDKHHPAVKQLKNIIHLWKRSMPWWQRILFALGLHSGKPLGLNFSPGDLWIPEIIPTSRPKDLAA